MGRKTIWAVILLVTIFGSVVTGCGITWVPSGQNDTPSRDTASWRMITTPSTATSQQTDNLIREIQNRSGGRLTIRVYTPSGLGFSSSELLNLLSTGIMEIGAAGMDSPSHPWQQLQNLAYFVENHDLTLYQKFAEAQYALAQDMYESEGIVGINPSGMPSLPSRMLLYSRKPVNYLFDIRGMKIKTEGFMQTTLIQALGGGATPLQLTELYIAMQTNMVSGALVSPRAAKSFSLVEVGKYAIGLWPTFSVTYYGANRKAFDRLPPDVQSVLLESFKEYANEVWSVVDAEQSDKDWENFTKEKGITYLKGFPGDDLTRLVKTARSLWPDMVSRFGSQGEQWLDIYETTTGIKMRKS